MTFSRAIFLSAFLIAMCAVASPALADDACTVGPYSGVCHPNGCVSGEIDLVSSFSNEPASGCAGTCCGKVGSALCSQYAAKAGVVNPPGMGFGCKPGNCAGSVPLSSLVTPVSGICGQGSECCQIYGQPIVAPTSTTGATTGGRGSAPIKLIDPLGGIGLLGIMNRVVNTFLGVLGAFALLVFIYAGVVYMTAGGAADRVKHAVDTMKYAIIGLALIVFSYAIILTYFRAVTGT